MKKRLSYGLLILGSVLVAVSVGMVIWSQIRQNAAQTKTHEIVKSMYARMPQEYNSAPDDRVDMTMARMELDGKDYVGILTVPAYDVRLPVYADWEPELVFQHPCRYMGSMHDGTLIIGGSDTPGQLDIMKQISMGDTVCMTDVTGARYRYEVAQIILTEDVSTQALCEGAYPLVFFARDTYGLHYTVVRCQ